MSGLRQLPIGPRVWLGFGAAVAALALSVGAFEISRLRVADQAAAAAQSRALLAQAGEIQALAKQNAIDSLQMLVSPSETQQKQLAQGLEQRNGTIISRLGELASRYAGTEDQALIEDIRKRHTTYHAGVKRIAGMVQAGKQTEAAFAADEEMTPMMTPFFAALQQLNERQQQRATEAETQVGALLARARVIALAVGAAGMLLALLAAAAIVGSVTRPLAQAVAMARRVGDGDLSHREEAAGRDEAAQLLRAMNQMSTTLGSVIDDVRRGSESVATASAQIAQGNQDLSQRTEQQAAALQQTASSMEQLGSTVRQTAEHAQEAHRMAQGASSTAQSGGQVVGDVVQTMRAINDSSRRIADITGVIDSIAFQTNILALNAAVEAARAGEQGRGFAVVAAEVRSLAKRSADAAREIKGLIQASVERVETGSQQADRAGRAMQDIVDSIQRVSTIVGEITRASQEQSAGVAQVGEAVSRMDEGTQHNAALVQESAAAAQSLKQQAQQLAQAVERFRVQPQLG